MLNEVVTAMFLAPRTGRTMHRVTVTSLDEVMRLHRKYPDLDIGVVFGKPEKQGDADPMWTYFPAIEKW